MSMGDQTGRLGVLSINQQHNHLAVALLGAVILAGAGGDLNARLVEVKRLYNGKSRLLQVLHKKWYRVFTRLSNTKNWPVLTDHVIPPE